MYQSGIYILTNKNRTTLYIGVTNHIERRILEHKSGYGSAFTSKYNLTILVYFEPIPKMQSAIDREKQLKRWHNEWKWNLIKTANPSLEDLASSWYTHSEIDDFKRIMRQMKK